MVIEAATYVCLFILDFNEAWSQHKGSEQVSVYSGGTGHVVICRLEWRHFPPWHIRLAKF